MSKHSGFNYEDMMRYEEVQQGIIRVADDIDEFETEKWLREVELLRAKKLPKVRVVITSLGGVAYHAFALYDALRKLSREGTEITCHVEGVAASAAAMILLQAGDVRTAGPSARFLLHEVRKWSFMEKFTKSDMEDTVREMKAIMERIIDILSSRCSQSRKNVKEMVERKETYMSAKEAKEWGLIDEVL